MRERLQEWAPYIGALGFALWVADGILKILGRIQDQVFIGLLVAGVILFALYIYARPSQVRAVVTSRGARYGSNALVLTLAFIGIVGVVNFLGSRYTYRWDLTANKSNSLADETIKVLKGLQEPVKATAFFTPNAEASQPDVANRLKLYASQSDKFTYQFIDPQAQPQIANDYNIQVDGTVVLERGARRENVLTADESGLTNALLKVSQDTQPSIYFTTGHGEHGLDDTGTNGYSIVKSGLQTDNYKVATLGLETITSTLPSDISALVIAGPHLSFQPQEVKLVQDYLANGGRVFIMVDPQVDSGLDGLLAAWGLKLRNDIILDPKFGLVGQPQVPVIQTYSSHDITKDLTSIGSFFPSIRSMTTMTATITGTTPTSLFASSDASWGETDFNSIKNQNPQFDAATDTKGPLDLAYAVQGSTDAAGRLVVLGNSTFVTNGTLSARVTASGQPVQTGNGQIFLNSIHWLANQTNLISIPPKAQSTSQMFLTGEQSLLLTVTTSLLLPIAMLILGTIVWWRRR
jgi:ABC-type uncharacterized transport system involved in gliding motility auxiliary subunit